MNKLSEGEFNDTQTFNKTTHKTNVSGTSGFIGGHNVSSNPG